MSLRVLVVLDASESAASADPTLLEALDVLGYQVRVVNGGDWRLTESIAAYAPDIVVIDSESGARDTIEHVVLSLRESPRPIALLTEHEGERAFDVRDLLRRGISAYVGPDVSAASLRPVLDVALARFDIEQQLKRELAESRAQLEDRKLVDRAKAVLMRQGLSEDDAHQRLRRMAMQKSLKLVEVAQRVIDVGELLS